MFLHTKLGARRRQRFHLSSKNKDPACALPRPSFTKLSAVTTAPEGPYGAAATEKHHGLAE